MIRSKIIELAVERMGIEENCSDADAADSMYVEDFVDNVIAALAQLLPDGELKTCEDFKDLGVACCDASHHSYCPHVDMKLVTLQDGSKAWLCCNLRTALLGPSGIEQPAAEVKYAAIAAKVAALPREERYRLAVELALECGDNFTDEQSFEFGKLCFGPDINITM